MSVSNVPTINANQAQKWLNQPHEIALIDVRELGEYSAGHPFLATPIPYSVFESRLLSLVPNKSCRIVIIDNNNGIAVKAAMNCISLDYKNVYTLEGGAAAWKSSGFDLFEGVNSPSKAFGELVEEKLHTPMMTAEVLTQRRNNGDDIVVLDGRPIAEYQKMNIPGAICCPNGELSLRIKSIVPDPKTTIVINCAGRTRSIVGAQILIDLEIENPVFALENGTQGWFLSNQQLGNNADLTYVSFPQKDDTAQLQSHALKIATRHKVSYLSLEDFQNRLSNTNQTTYIFDIRTKEEYDSDGLVFTTHAPGGQLIQSTDTWVATRGALIVLVDTDHIRAPIIASWLNRLGHKCAIIDCGFEQLKQANIAMPDYMKPVKNSVEIMEIHDCKMLVGWTILDIRPALEFRKMHLRHAIWTNRATVQNLKIEPSNNLLLVSECLTKTALFAKELINEGHTGEMKHLGTSLLQLQQLGVEIEATPEYPNDADSIDFIFHTHDRHSGNADAARTYLSWEKQLVSQLHATEYQLFKI